MKKIFLMLALGTSLNLLAGVPDSVYLCSYNVHAGGGLNLAWSANREVWKPIGPGHAFIKSDFSTWGAGKKMYNPNMLRMPDGTWRCVFEVNNFTNQFAVAYTRDLMKWRPQDYPYMEGVSSCIAPILSYDVKTAIYKVVFKTKEGETYQTTSKDFYNFTKPVKVAADEYVAKSEPLMVDGRTISGQVFKVPYAEVEHIEQYVASVANQAVLNAELARDNERRFRGMKPLEATIKVNTDNKKKISDKLIGIFFEDINYAADGGLYAELVQNRDFEYSLDDLRGQNKAWKADYAWALQGDGGSWTIQTENPIHVNNPHYAVVDVKKAGSVALMNSGFAGIVVLK